MDIWSNPPFVPTARELLNKVALSVASVAQWADYKWNVEWRQNTSRLNALIADISSLPLEISFTKIARVKVNRLQTGVGIFRSTTHKWGMAASADCDCGAKKQKSEHLVTSCPI